MTRGRRILFAIALVFAVIMVAGRFLRQDERYLHASHVSEFNPAMLGTA
jgi:hypothetical protein